MAGMESQRGDSPDAIAQLTADHRQVESLFGQLADAPIERKRELGAAICAALRTHALLEQEIFYPAYLEATGDQPTHHEAAVEHEAANRLIEQIESPLPSDEFFEARLSVLAEMVRHHVAEEERPGGMFARAAESGMELEQLGRRLLERRRELEGGGAAVSAAARRVSSGILGRILEVASR